MRVLFAVLTQKDVPTETFIRNHINHLGDERRAVYGVTPKALQNGENKKRFHQMLKQYAPDVVVAEYGPAGVAVAAICEAAGVPLVVHFHGFDAYRNDIVRGFQQAYPEMFRQAALVIAVSDDMRHQLIALGAPESKVVSHPYGIDTEKFGRSGAYPDKIRFVSVGRFVEKKAPLLSLTAFWLTYQRYSDCSYTMVGDGPLLNVCREHAHNLGIAEAVEFTGALGHDTVNEVLQSSSVFIQHSLRPRNGDSEGTPLSVIEACAKGLPVVATRHAGIPEVVGENVNGYLVEEGDVRSMAAKMLFLCRNQDFIKSLGQAGLKKARYGFANESYIAGLRSIIGQSFRGGKVGKGGDVGGEDSIL
jgi:glycosyltransferase involved in cell wall biosynthesis